MFRSQILPWWRSECRTIFSLGQIGQIGLCDASRILFTLFGSYIVLRLMYNRYFHPLRNFPGPIWGSLTDFYKLYIVAQKDAHTRGIEMHKKYGLKLQLP